MAANSSRGGFAADRQRLVGYSARLFVVVDLRSFVRPSGGGGGGGGGRNKPQSRTIN